MYPSNIKFNSSHSSDMTLTIEPKLWQLIEPIALEHPTWDFVEYSSNGIYKENPDTRRDDMVGIKVYDIKVVCGDEMLGNIAVQTYGARKYTMRNPRISDALDRRTYMTTSDIKKATKIVKKYFYAKTDMERIKESAGRAGSKLADFVNDKDYKVRNLFSNLRDPAINFLNENLSDFSAYARANFPTARFDLIDDMPSILTESAGANEIHKAYQNGDACMVYTDGDGENYALSDQEAKDIRIVYREELPPIFIQRIGMLKLVEVGQAIMGVGFRASEKVFIVMTT